MVLSIIYFRKKMIKLFRHSVQKKVSNFSLKSSKIHLRWKNVKISTFHKKATKLIIPISMIMHTFLSNYAKSNKKYYLQSLTKQTSRKSPIAPPSLPGAPSRKKGVEVVTQWWRTYANSSGSFGIHPSTAESSSGAGRHRHCLSRAISNYLGSRLGPCFCSPLNNSEI